MLEQCVPPGAPHVPQPSRLGLRIHAAAGADTLVPLEHLLPHISRLGTQLPLVHTIVGTEGESAPRHLQRTPPAQPASIRPARHRLPVYPSAAHHAHNAHDSYLSQRT